MIDNYVLVHGKVELQFQIGTTEVIHPAYIPNIHGSYILKLYFLQKHNFVIDLQHQVSAMQGVRSSFWVLSWVRMWLSLILNFSKKIY